MGRHRKLHRAVLINEDNGQKTFFVQPPFEQYITHSAGGRPRLERVGWHIRLIPSSKFGILDCTAYMAINNSPQEFDKETMLGCLYGSTNVNDLLNELGYRQEEMGTAKFIKEVNLTSIYPGRYIIYEVDPPIILPQSRQARSWITPDRGTKDIVNQIQIIIRNNGNIGIHLMEERWEDYEPISTFIKVKRTLNPTLPEVLSLIGYKPI